MHKIEELIADIAAAKMVILVDDENRENEGDIICAGSLCTPEHINFMAMHARGLICLSAKPQVIDRLGLKLMVPEEENATTNKTAFTVSIEAAEGISTGISAADRSKTVRVASSKQSTAKDIISPGHIFPLRANEKGVLGRNGHTEASVDLVQLAGAGETAVICEIMNEDGSMARLEDLYRFSEKFHIKIGSIEKLVEYLTEKEIQGQKK